MRYSRRAALLLALGVGPAAFGQRFMPRVDYCNAGGGSVRRDGGGDMNGNSRPDIVAGYNAAVSVLLGNVNRDGCLDVVTANGIAGSVSVLLNSASAPGTFLPITTYSNGSGARIVALANMNGDGRPGRPLRRSSCLTLWAKWCSANQRPGQAFGSSRAAYRPGCTPCGYTSAVPTWPSAWWWNNPLGRP